jgi:SUKH-3 immunity protein
MISLFTEKTLWCLKQAGWDENYRANIDLYLQELKQEGCEVPLPVVNFLERFDNLRVIVPFIYRAGTTLDEVFASGHYDSFQLNPYKTAQNTVARGGILLKLFMC